MVTKKCSLEVTKEITLVMDVVRAVISREISKGRNEDWWRCSQWRELLDRRPRHPPSHRKYHYAFHKGQEGKYCSSHSCIALKKISFEE